MFVRWKRRKRIAKDPFTFGRKHVAKTDLSAVLVRCERLDGKPRQRIVAYLGTIQEGYLKGEHSAAREYFWENADRRLSSLGLAKTERQEIEAALVARVPRPTAEEVEERKRFLMGIATSLRDSDP
jgi:hypothetical protein